MVLSYNSPALVVEDDFLLAMQMKDYLADFGCHETLIATRLEEAFLALSAGIRFAVIDVSLAGESCNELAAKLAVAGIPYIYVSGYQREDFPTCLLRHGCPNQPPKPICERPSLPRWRNPLLGSTQRSHDRTLLRCTSVSLVRVRPVVIEPIRHRAIAFTSERLAPVVSSDT